MKKNLFLLLTFFSFTLTAAGNKNFSDFAGDLNGDGFTDVVIVKQTNSYDFFGSINIFFGTAEGLSTQPGFTYNCKISNYLESIFDVHVIGDVNGDGTDELSMKLTNLSGERTGRSHQSIYLFYGNKNGVEKNPVILQIQGDGMNKYSLRSYHAFDYNGDGFTDILAVSSKRIYKTLETGWTDKDRKLLLFRGSKSGIDSNYETLRDIDDDNNIFFKSAGDVNNDGIEDMLSFEYSKNGKDAVWTQYLSNKNHQPEIKPFISYRLNGTFSSDRTYNGSIWDINGDKYDDNMIMREDNPPLFNMKKADSTAYKIEFYPGSANGLLDTIAFTWSIKSAPLSFLEITTVGDLNNDDYGDLIMQSFTPVPKQISIMKAYIVWGSKNGPQPDTSENFNTFLHSLKNVDDGNRFIDSPGDINNDGFADLIVGGATVVYGSKDGKYKTVELKLLQ